ncbi:DMT family transporter [Alteromonas sp. ASW11-130]|uniref:DMT family transporter n=1 Tax=Alteromonas sp. ASW11-130 TaxID=3015775 RepID=UPI002241A0CC|nr:EamA family transporter [Alteromonas sp. ASW11-130]MCW8093226.1 DMT family transporter [Alteromonas sp. ASW11-130]
MPVKDLAALLLLGAIWGASFIFMRVAVPEFGVFALVEVRTLLATIVLLAVLVFRSGMRDMFTHWKAIALIGAVNTAIPFVLFNYSSLYLEAGVNAILNATAPMFGAVIAFLWLCDKLSKKAVLGLLLGFAGVIMISLQKMGEQGVTIIPIITALLATTCYGLAASMMKKYLQGVKPLAVATGSQASASLLLMPFAIYTMPETMPSVVAWNNAIALAVLGTGIAYILYFSLIANIGPAKAITVAYLVPLFGIVWGLVFLSEKLSLPTLMGGGLILIGVAMTTGVSVSLFKRRRAPA